MLIRVGTIGNTLFEEARQVPRQQPGGVLDAVDPGVEHVIQGVFGEAVCGDAGPLIVGGPDGVLDRPGGKTGGEVAGVAVDPVPHELDPAVARAGLLPHGLDEILRFDLDGQARQVAPGPGEMPAGADDPGQVRALLEPACVVDGAGVADQECPGVAVRQGLGFRGVLGNVPARAEADVAVRVHEAGHDPAVQHEVRRGGRTAEGQQAAHRPEPAAFLVRRGEDGAAELDDAGHDLKPNPHDDPPAKTVQPQLRFVDPQGAQRLSWLGEFLETAARIKRRIERDACEGAKRHR